MKQLMLLIGLLIPTIGFARSYSISWYKVAGGGGTSTNGQCTLSGTTGQPDASGAMTGGNYSLTGGFWAIYAVQSSGTPADYHLCRQPGCCVVAVLGDGVDAVNRQQPRHDQLGQLR
jgi:hypothetical protein